MPEPQDGEGGAVVDLMEALRQSVAATADKRAPAKKKTAAKRKPARQAS